MVAKIFSELNSQELSVFKKLNTPQKIQDYLDTLPINFSETSFSPRLVLRHKKAHCLEGAIFAAAVLYYYQEEPLLMDLKTNGDDDDHVVTLFRRDGLWGAISKTNHATLRYREPIYKTTRELAISYFHEYFIKNGQKVLRSYSAPYSLKKFDNKKWLTDQKDLLYIADSLDESPHQDLVAKSAIKKLRLADKMERRAGDLLEWSRSGKKVKPSVH